MLKSKKNKKNTSIEDLCGKLPKEFAKYLNYCRSLNFEDKPCISDLKKLFKKLLTKKGLDQEGKFDWVNKKNKLPKDVGYGWEDDEEEEDLNYKDKLKALLG